MDFSMANCGIPLPHKQFNSALEVILLFFLKTLVNTLPQKKASVESILLLLLFNNWNQGKEKKQQRDGEENNDSESSTPAA